MPDLDSIRVLCRSFPDVTEDMPWPDDLCFKVRGKIFTTLVLSDGRFPRITFKCTPEEFRSLIEIEGIAPAAYVGRYHWVTLAHCNVLPANQLEELIRRSYHMVASKAPHKKSAQKSARKSGGKKVAPRKPAKKKSAKRRR
jgi:predicted DNA-binding protein (MmcQ/YjbR family)